MKRILAAALSLALLVSLAACGGKERFDTGKVEEGVCYQLTGIAPDAVAMRVTVSTCRWICIIMTPRRICTLI